MPPPSAEVEIIDKSTAYQGHIRIDIYRLRHKLYDGGWGREIRREVAERGHAVAVLPYDPQRDAVVLIEQFRIGAFAHGGEDVSWLIEIVAGLVGDDEAARDVARREAEEEAGLALGEMVHVASYYASPGAVSEHVEVYCARVDSQGAGGVHGLDEEGEDIRVVVLPFDQAMAELEAGRIKFSPAIIALQWLALNRESLRARWG
jgi:ADP-ribose pyrophosphatase